MNDKYSDAKKRIKEILDSDGHTKIFVFGNDTYFLLRIPDPTKKQRVEMWGKTRVVAEATILGLMVKTGVFKDENGEICSSSKKIPIEELQNEENVKYFEPDFFINKLAKYLEKNPDDYEPVYNGIDGIYGINPFEYPDYPHLNYISGNYNFFKFNIYKIGMASKKLIKTPRERLSYLKTCKYFFEKWIEMRPEYFLLWQRPTIVDEEHDAMWEKQIQNQYRDLPNQTTDIIGWMQTGDFSRDWAALKIEDFISGIEYEIEGQEVLVNIENEAGVNIQKIALPEKGNGSIGLTLPIRWIKPLSELKFLLTELENRSFLSLFEDLAIISKRHFCIINNQNLGLDSVKVTFPVGLLEPIRWMRSLPGLIYLLTELRKKQFMDFSEDPTSLKEIIENHFCDKNGEGFQHILQQISDIKNHRKNGVRKKPDIDSIIDRMSNLNN